MAMRLLVVDDDPDVLKVVKTLLESLGYVVLASVDSLKAAELADHQKFDGVFLDARMPHLDGAGLARRIRNSPSNSSVPIVMLTGYDDVETMRAGFRAGITFFMGKPPEVNQLAALLKPLRGAMLRQKRSYVRLPLRTVVTCRTAQHQFTSASLNIGEGGMLLDHSGGLELGQELDLQFTLPGNPQILNPHAKVVRSEAPDRIGVQFVAASSEDRKAIRDFIAGRVKE